MALALRTLVELNESGDWAADNAAGRELANQWLREMRERNAPNLLGAAMRGIAESGRWGGIEVGFTHVIAEGAM